MDKVKAPPSGGQQLLRIGEVAARTGLSAKAIRIYERDHLIEPPARTAAGYRSYTEAQVATLAFIRQAKALGLRLSEIAEVVAIRQVGDAPCEAVSALLDRRIKEIDRALADLRALRRTLVQARRREWPNAQVGPATICPIIEATPLPD